MDIRQKEYKGKIYQYALSRNNEVLSKDAKIQEEYDSSDVVINYAYSTQYKEVYEVFKNRVPLPDEELIDLVGGNLMPFGGYITGSTIYVYLD